MKKFRKIMAVLVAAMMIMAMAVPAMSTKVWAASDYKITIANAMKGETYSAYKIFDVSDASASGTVTYVEATGEASNKITYYQRTQDPVTGQYDYAIASPQPTGTLTGGDYYLRRYVSYTIKETDPWWPSVNTYITTYPSAGLTKTKVAGTADTWVITFTEGTFSAADFAEKMKADLDANIAAHAEHGTDLFDTPKDSNSTGTGDGISPGTANVVLDVGEAGYYLVNTSMGSVASLDTASKTITMYEKNSSPTIAKLISDDNTNWGTEVNVNEGDPVYYKITVTDGRTTDKALVVHDVLDTGVTLTNAFTVKTIDVSNSNAETTLTAGEGYTITYKNGLTVNPKLTGVSSYTSDACSFELTFPANVIKSLDEGDKIEITYAGVLNASALIYDSHTQLTNDNETWLKYSEQTSAHVEVKARTFEFRVYKIDSETGNPIGGVDFILTNEAGDKWYQGALDTNTDGATTTRNVWKDSKSVVSTAASTGVIDFVGLEAGTYILTEDKAANGYNPLTDTVKITVKNDGTIEAETKTGGVAFVITPSTGTGSSLVPTNFTVQNTPGKALPSTGGMGTTVLYIVGGMLIVLAGAYLFFSKKKTA